MSGILALSHDVDDIHKRRRQLVSLYKAHKGNFDSADFIKKILKGHHNWFHLDMVTDLESDFGVKSTVFFMVDGSRYSIDDKLKDYIQELDSKGWEIGVHGSIESSNSQDTIKKEKEILEHIVGHKIHGIRQHYLKLTEKTWSFQKSGGFAYDSSVGNAHNITLDQPFYPLEKFMVLPINAMDTFMFENVYMGLSLDKAKSKILSSLQQVTKNNLIFTIDIHQDWLIFRREMELYRYVLQNASDLGIAMWPLKDVVSSLDTS